MSGSYYMVVRCVPDAIADERVNVGIIAWEADRTRFLCRFVDDLSRAHAIGLNGDGQFLFDYFADMRSATAGPLDSRAASLLEKDLRRMQGWGGTIQHSGWCGSILSADETLELVVRLFIKTAVS